MSLMLLSEKFEQRRFIGRKTELDRLAKMFSSSRQRGPFFISGIHGIGKTSVAYELLRQVGLPAENKVAYVDFRTLEGDTDAALLANAAVSILSSARLPAKNVKTLHDALQRLTHEHVVILDELEVLQMAENKQTFLPLMGMLWRNANSVKNWPKVVVITRHNWSYVEAENYKASRRLATSNLTLGALEWEDASALLQERLGSIDVNDDVLASYLGLAGGHPWIIDIIADSLEGVVELPDTSEKWDEIYQGAMPSLMGIWGSLSPEQRILLASRASPEVEVNLMKEGREMQLYTLRDEGLVGSDLRSLFSPVFSIWLVSNNKALFPNEAEVEAKGTNFSVSTVKTVLETLNSATKLLDQTSHWWH